MRYPSLESLRGLAALVVVIHHHLLVLPTLYPYNLDATGLAGWLTSSPLHLVWAGSEAVLFFFVLSGFVLSLGVWQGRPLDMQAFLVRRLWRIWVPFMVAVTLGWLCAALIGPTHVPGTSALLDLIWTGAGWQAYLQHALMLDQMDTLSPAFDPVVWSLKWEMWLSLLLPLALMLVRQRSLTALGGTLGLLVLYWVTGGNALERYFSMFVLGVWLSRHRGAIGAWVGALPRTAQAGLLVLALLLIPLRWYGWGLALDGPHGETLLDLATVAGSGLLIALALGWEGWRGWLERPSLSWLGRISYSLYLYHTLVLAAVVRLGAGALPVWALLIVSFALTFPIAHLAYQWVEVPAMRRGQRRRAAAAFPTT